ncbi:ribosomal protein S5 domain 2-type protein [Lipomyces oligophaga]|uniref:ribosomal protein S5 domain 2-type protein n=1 Tax=Lipomyces oligophaga TaxID=45792 RepID=UPI0034CEDC96
MSLSVTEAAYLYSSLLLQPPCRPDGRDQYRFRPMDASVGILPSTNGSARIRLCDGGECIVGVKAEVEYGNSNEESASIEVECEIAGLQAGSSPLPNLLSSTLQTILISTLPSELLTVLGRYRFKLFIDGVIIDHFSHPLTLFSMTVYLALLNTSLPKVTNNSEESDESHIEQDVPQFSSDWQDSVRLCKSWTPPLVQMCILVGQNVFFDATKDECNVSDGGISAVWHKGKIIGLKVLNTQDSSNQVFSLQSIKKSITMLPSAFKDLELALLPFASHD